MDNFREKLKIQNVTMAICVVVLAVFCVLGIAGEAGLVSFMTPSAGDSHWQSQWRGFISGVSFGILAIMIFGLVRNLRAMKDERKLKKLYIKETDERMIKIWKEARNSGMVTFLLLGLVAAIAAGYFNTAICLTILACVFFNSAICLWFVLYYSKKF